MGEGFMKCRYEDNTVNTMGDCELCGATKVSTREHRVNKAMLAICQKCVGQMNLEPKQEAPGLARARRTPAGKPQSRTFRKNNIMNKTERELAEDFSRRIVNGREAKGWSQAQLGQRMAETINVIKSAESGKAPTDSVVRKFEMILGIELMIESTGEHQSMIGKGANSRGMTIGDYLKDLR
jgi:uncharacterized protein (TIGR00270 family)